ncbi:MAG: hypothetical protein F4W92_00680 [Gammaproteobacteria bacterium]|nr:hypothetical protein [Gammaproteobacteria bacterium]
MSRTIFVIVTLGTSIVAVVLGFLISKSIFNHDQSELPLESGDTAETKLSNQETDDNKLTLPEIESQAQLDTRFDRELTLHNLLVNANVRDLSLYLSQSEKLKSQNFLRESQDKIIQRWSVVDPVSALKVVMEYFSEERQSFLIPLVFREWSRLNLSEAIKHAQGLDEYLMDAVVDTIVISREDLPVAQRRDIARNLDREWRVIELLRKEGYNSVFEAPAKEWSTFIRKHQGELQHLSNSQLRIMGYIVRSWVTQEGVKVITQVREELPRAISLLTTTEFVSRELVKTQPATAFELVISAAGIDHHRGYLDLAIELIEVWASTNFTDAINATLAIKAKSFRWELQKSALRAAAQEDVDRLLNDLDSLPEHLRVRAHAQALVEIAKTSPKSISERWRDIHEIEERERVVDAIVRGWAKKDVAEVFQWIENTLELPLSRHKLKETVFRELVVSNWQLAFQTALSLPRNIDGAGWEGTVVKWLANWNSDIAESLLVKVRSGPGRIDAFDGVIFNAIKDKDFQRALEVFLRLCELEEHADQSLYLMPLAYTVPDLVFASIDKIASARARVKVAHRLLYRYADSDVFTTDEIERLKQIKNSDVN